MLLGGDFFTVNGKNSHALAVVDAGTGAVTKTYTNIPSNSVVKDISTDATGFYTGNEGSGGGVFDGRIGLNLSDFSEKWRDRCLGATQFVLPYQGVLYSSSHAHNCETELEFPDGKRHFLLAQPTNHEGAAPRPRTASSAAPASSAGTPRPTTDSARASARASWPWPRRATSSTCGSAVSSPSSTARPSRA